MLKFTLLFPFFFLTFLIYSQEFEQELKEAIRVKPKLEFRFDSRNSFISSSSVRIAGIKAGVQFDNKLSIGLGYNQLWSIISNKSLNWQGNVLSGEIKYNYLSPYIDYIFYRDERWELSIPIQLGFGNSYYLNQSEIGPKKLNKSFVVSYEPAISFEYRIFRYFGLGMGVGYRLMVIPNREIEERFTSPVYIFKVKIYFQELYNQLLKK